MVTLFAEWISSHKDSKAAGEMNYDCVEVQQFKKNVLRLLSPMVQHVILLECPKVKQSQVVGVFMSRTQVQSGTSVP